MTERGAPPTGERIQKILANAGYGSRREIERRIAAGEVWVNGKPARLGERITPQDKVVIGRQKVGAWRLAKVVHRTIAYNKPEGVLVTRSDPQGRPNVFEQLPRLAAGRWIAVGRLDINTSGLVIFTTDGELANRLMHPSGQIEREYAVRVLGEVGDAMILRLVNGVELEDGPARFEDVVESGGEGANRWFHVVIMEGRKREVRRLWESVGVKVSRLKRVRFGPIMLENRLMAGKWRELQGDELRSLQQLAGLQPQRGAGSEPPTARDRKRARIRGYSGGKGRKRG